MKMLFLVFLSISTMNALAVESVENRQWLISRINESNLRCHELNQNREFTHKQLKAAVLNLNLSIMKILVINNSPTVLEFSGDDGEQLMGGQIVFAQDEVTVKELTLKRARSNRVRFVQNGKETIHNPSKEVISYINFLNVRCHL